MGRLGARSHLPPGHRSAGRAYRPRCRYRETLALFRSRRPNPRLRSRTRENDHRTSPAKRHPARRPGASSVALRTGTRRAFGRRSCRCSFAWRPKRPPRAIIASRACRLFCSASPSNPRLMSAARRAGSHVRRTCSRLPSTDDDAAIRSLERILGVPAETLDTTPPTATLDRVRTWLFSSDPPPSAPPDPALLFSAPGESFECVEIARRIRALAQARHAFRSHGDPASQRRSLISRWWKKRCAAPASRITSAVAPRVPIPQAAPFSLCWPAPAKAAPHRASPNIFRSDQTPPLDHDGAPKSRPLAMGPRER